MFAKLNWRVVCTRGKWNMPRNQLRRENINLEESEYRIPRTKKKKTNPTCEWRKWKSITTTILLLHGSGLWDMVIQLWEKGHKKKSFIGSMQNAMSRICLMPSAYGSLFNCRLKFWNLNFYFSEFNFPFYLKNILKNFSLSFAYCSIGCYLCVPFTH